MIAHAFNGSGTYAADRDGTVWRMGRTQYYRTGFSLMTRGYRLGQSSAGTAGAMLSALVRAQFTS